MTDATQSVDYYEAGDHAKAFDVALTQTESGDSYAQYLVGHYYSKGVCVEENLDEAARWLRRASHSGDVRADFLLGLILEETGEHEQAITAYKNGLKTGYPPSIARLGKLTYATDKKLGIRHTKLAIKEGHAGARIVHAKQVMKLGWLFLPIGLALYLHAAAFVILKSLTSDDPVGYLDMKSNEDFWC